MPLMKAEEPERYGPGDASHLPNELERLREQRVADAAAELGSHAVETAGIAEKTRTDEIYSKGAQAWENWDQYNNRPA
jgi:hypothetical protein